MTDRHSSAELQRVNYADRGFTLYSKIYYNGLLHPLHGVEVAADGDQPVPGLPGRPSHMLSVHTRFFNIMFQSEELQQWMCGGGGRGERAGRGCAGGQTAPAVGPGEGERGRGEET